MSDNPVTVLEVTDDGAVWAQTLGAGPRQIADSAVEYATSHGSNQASLRMFGTRRNAALIVELCERGANLQVGAPPVDYGHTAVVALLNRALAEPQRPCSLGGWHAVSDAELRTYAICYLVNTNASKSALVRAATTHPLWPYLAFISTINPAAVAEWMALVVDPRWYAVDRPERAVSRLCQYLQVTPLTARVALSDTEAHTQSVSVSVSRYRATVRCWADWDNAPPQPLGPRDFLWRIFASVAEKKPLDTAAVRATQLFVRYARAAWLEVLAGNTAGGDGLLVPSEFLKRPDELQAFNEYIAGATP
jgi:hypothetical protein